MDTLKKSPASVRANGVYASSPSPGIPGREQIQPLIAALEIPFRSSLIEWRVMKTSDEGTRGQIAPYADPRAYTDRLNEIFTPAGWTRKYTVSTSANFERSDDKKLVAKVFVTCDLTIHGIGSHSAMGEEWADDEFAGTSAEAQAFKRACSCFGLGRYLYNFAMIWVDLDERGRPRETPELFGWATPDGWRKGQRPEQQESQSSQVSKRRSSSAKKASKRFVSAREKELIQQIEAIAEPLGKSLYRGLLKSIARAWKPSDIRNLRLLEQVFASMQSAERFLERVKAAQDKIGPEGLKSVLEILEIKSIEKLNNLDMLQRLVVALEEKVETV